MIRGVIPPGIDIGVKQRLESLSKAITLPSATAYSILGPAANSSNRGEFIIIRDVNGVDILYCCMLSSGGTYYWHPISQSS